MFGGLSLSPVSPMGPSSSLGSLGSCTLLLNEKLLALYVRLIEPLLTINIQAAFYFYFTVLEKAVSK